MLRTLLIFSLIIVSTNFAQAAEQKRAVFAGGCFWCMEAEFEATKGVLSVTSGYTGGKDKNPEYYAVASGKTGHAEAVDVRYDPDIINYEQLLDIYWSNIDFTDAGGQFADRGSQYRTEIFYLSKEQQKLAEASRAALAKRKGIEVVTNISALEQFHAAEEHHQDYYKKNSARYKLYKYGSGRVKRLEELNKD
jgi:methionine-S-sulfoxide reductase